MKTVHLVFNAHIDPIWLWPWSAGLDEVLNTCETVCNLLDRHPDVIFTRGEAWVYEQVERLHPRLFERIKKLIKAGQWEVTGGWYVQPDCNLPSDFGFRKQIELGRAYFKSKLGLFPATAYNVDSFGHSSFLPELMAGAGQANYVMMRPMKNEMTLPARLFRWRGRVGGPEVTTFRIAHAYCTSRGITLEHVEESLTELPAGIEHTMCFVGLGDHGGGPSEEMIAWCRKHRDAIPGARLEFSSPARFFRAVARQKAALPVVTGELQMHAIGCYSVHRPVKLGIRRAEHLLAQAEEAVKTDKALARQHAKDLEKGWQWVCFNHFHDTMGGTCLPSAYPQVDAQLGFSRAVADEVIQYALRRSLAGLPADPRQRLVLANYSGADFEEWAEHEPWLEWTRWQPDWCLLDEKGNEVPHQVIPLEANFPHNQSPRLLFKLKIPGGRYRILRIARRKKKAPKNPSLARLKVEKAESGLSIRMGKSAWPVPQFEIIEDTSDTWSHNIHSFEGKTTGKMKWERPRPIAEGPLMDAWLVKGRIGKSFALAEWRSYAGDSFLELRLRVTWLETQRLLRMSWKPGTAITYHLDGVAGGSLRRQSNGREYPFHDWTSLELGGGKAAGVIAPDTYSLSATPTALRLTLLRASYMADHDHEFSKRKREKDVVSDQGEQSFIFRFYRSGETVETMKRHALALHRPPQAANLTRGMPWRPHSFQVERFL
jgi:alpha-mannosidase